MSKWPSAKSSQVLRALFRIGWQQKRQSGTSHIVLQKEGWPDFVFSFHQREEIGHKMLAHISKLTGLHPEDL